MNILRAWARNIPESNVRAGLPQRQTTKARTASVARKLRRSTFSHAAVSAGLRIATAAISLLNGQDRAPCDVKFPVQIGRNMFPIWRIDANGNGTIDHDLDTRHTRRGTSSPPRIGFLMSDLSSRPSGSLSDAFYNLHPHTESKTAEMGNSQKRVVRSFRRSDLDVKVFDSGRNLAFADFGYPCKLRYARTARETPNPHKPSSEVAPNSKYSPITFVVPGSCSVSDGDYCRKRMVT
jgi:hypothetical protein